MIGNQHKDHQCPGKLGHQVSGGAPYAHQADEVGHHAGDEDGANQGNVVVKTGAHVAPDKLQQAGHSHFCHSLLPGNIGHPKPGTQPDTKPCDDEHHQPAGGEGLGDLDGSEQGNIFNGCQNFCTGNREFHEHYLTSIGG